MGPTLVVRVFFPASERQLSEREAIVRANNKNEIPSICIAGRIMSKEIAGYCGCKLGILDRTIDYYCVAYRMPMTNC